MKVIFVNCEEVIVEDYAQEDVEDCFYAMFDDQVFLVDDEGNETPLNTDNTEFVDSPVTIEIPEGYYAHMIGWRTSEFIIKLNDPTHIVTPADFTWSNVIVNGDEWEVPSIKESVGELEFECSWDGRYDEEITPRIWDEDEDW